MFVIKDRVRKYYKYVYVEWTQPILSSNGTMGGDSFACNQSSVYSSCYAWCAFAESGMWHSAEGQNPPQWLSWYNPRILKINNIKINVGNGSSNPDLPNEYKIQGSDDNTNWVDVYSATNSQTSPIPLTLNIDLTSNPNRAYKYWRYYVVNVKSRNFGNASKIILDALEQQIVESTSSDYDFYVDDTIIYKTPNEIERKYYKYIDTKEPNATTEGSLTISNGIVSGFSSSNYMILPFNFIHGNNAWKVQFKVTTGTDVSSQGCICEQRYDGSYYYGLTIYIQSGTLRVRCGNGSSIFWDVDTSYSIVANTTYWIKAEFTGTQYIIYASIDGENWTTVNTLSSTTIATNDYTMYLGRRNYGTSAYSPWLGSIDFNQSFITVNNEELWHGTVIETQESTSSDYDFYEDISHIKVYKSF